MRDNKLNMSEKVNKKFRLSPKDIVMGLLIVLTASSAIVSIVLLQNVYNDDKAIPDSSVNADESLKTESIIKSQTNMASKSITTATTKKIITTRPVARFYVDVNDVTKEQLLMIDGMGQALAQRIILYRESVGVISEITQLLQIEGIGEAKLDTLKQFLYVSDKYSNTTTKTSEDPVVMTTKVTTQAVTEPREPCQVNINTAYAEDIARCLCIDIDVAVRIVEFREQISYYSNSLELLYVEGFSEKMHSELKNYIIL